MHAILSGCEAHTEPIKQNMNIRNEINVTI